MDQILAHPFNTILLSIKDELSSHEETRRRRLHITKARLPGASEVLRNPPANQGDMGLAGQKVPLEQIAPYQYSCPERTP